jgi:hypothetical protein
MQLGGSPIRGRGELPCAVVGALLCPCGGGGCMAAGPAQQHAKEIDRASDPRVHSSGAERCVWPECRVCKQQCTYELVPGRTVGIPTAVRTTSLVQLCVCP